jgi:hypothetical protein
MGIKRSQEMEKVRAQRLFKGGRLHEKNISSYCSVFAVFSSCGGGGGSAPDAPTGLAVTLTDNAAS